MASKAKTQQCSEYDDTDSVNVYMESLEHPLKPVIEGIRQTILEADQGITEGIKWNAPSFYCHGWFATFHLRVKKGVQIVLHHGAKIRNDTTLSSTLDDSSRLLNWPSKDRAIVNFVSIEDFQSKEKAFKKIIKQWADYQVHLASSS